MTDNLGIGNVSKNASVSDPNDSSLVSDGTSGNRISHAAHANGAFAKTSRPKFTGSIIMHSYQNMHLNRHRAPGRVRWATEASGPTAPTPPRLGSAQWVHLLDRGRVVRRGPARRHGQHRGNPVGGPRGPAPAASGASKAALQTAGRFGCARRSRSAGSGSGSICPGLAGSPS